MSANSSMPLSCFQTSSQAWTPGPHAPQHTGFLLPPDCSIYLNSVFCLIVFVFVGIFMPNLFCVPCLCCSCFFQSNVFFSSHGHFCSIKRCPHLHLPPCLFMTECKINQLDLADRVLFLWIHNCGQARGSWTNLRHAPLAVQDMAPQKNDWSVGRAQSTQRSRPPPKSEEGRRRTVPWRAGLRGLSERCPGAFDTMLLLEVNLVTSKAMLVLEVNMTTFNAMPMPEVNMATFNAKLLLGA